MLSSYFAIQHSTDELRRLRKQTKASSNQCASCLLESHSYAAAARELRHMVTSAHALFLYKMNAKSMSLSVHTALTHGRFTLRAHSALMVSWRPTFQAHLLSRLTINRRHRYRLDEAFIVRCCYTFTCKAAFDHAPTNNVVRWRCRRESITSLSPSTTSSRPRQWRRRLGSHIGHAATSYRIETNQSLIRRPVGIHGNSEGRLELRWQQKPIIRLVTIHLTRQRWPHKDHYLDVT